MIDVLLIQPPISDFYLTYQRIFPLGLWLIATYLNNRNIKTKILDALANNEKKEIKIPDELNYLSKYYIKEDKSPFALFKNYYRFGLQEEKILKKIDEYQPGIIGISNNFTTYFQDVLKLAKRIKNEFEKIKIVIAGHNTLVMKEELLKYDFIDFIYLDFVPENFYKLVLQILNNENNFHLINGIGFKNEKNIIINQCTNKNIRFDIPDINLLDFENYKIGKYKSVSLIRNFGCNYKCNFCSVNKMFYTYYKFDDYELISLIKRLIIEKRIKSINFEDDNFFYNKNDAKNFLNLFFNELSEYDPRIYFMNGLVYHLLDEEMIKLLKKCGLKNLNISAVHFDVHSNENLNREYNEKKLFEIIDCAVKNDMLVTTYLIVGLPEQKFCDVIDFINKLHNHKSLIGISPFYLYPSSIMYEKIKEKVEKIPYIQMRGTAIPIFSNKYNRDQIIYTLRYVRYLNSLLDEKNNISKLSEKRIDLLTNKKLTNDELKILLLKIFIENKEIKGIKIKKINNNFEYQLFDYE
ncbi:MAG TPA: radical SAM protein [bacterium]|nr:radical SAM protein [bacterium]HOL47095.1 radical SAM protein [bacterium]HPQ18849.1 radical SAM protein [bacterium]